MPVNHRLAAKRMETRSRYSDEPVRSAWRGVLFGCEVELLALLVVIAAAVIVHAVFP